MIRLTGAFMVALTVVCGARLEGAQPTFQPLTFSQDGDGFMGASGINGVSADGSAAFGYNGTDLFAREWLFNSSGQITGNAYPRALNGEFATANAASADGSVVAGTQTDNSGGLHAFYWTAATGGNYIGTLPGSGVAYGAGNGISANGTVVVGGIFESQGANGLQSSQAEQAFSWTAPGGVSLLGTLPGMTTSVANGVSANGASVVGSSSNGSGGQEACLWTSGGMTPLGFLPGTSTSTAISGNGQVVIGYSGNEAFRWTAAGGMVSLGALVGTGPTEALATSFDGSEIVGEFGGRAFLWNQAQGMIDLGAKLLALNPPPYGGNYNYKTSSISGWSLDAATGVSADGTTIVGNGYDGIDGGWMATLPEPSTGVLAAFGFLVVAWRLRRRD